MKVNGHEVTLNPKVETITRSLLIGFSAFKWAGTGALDGGRVSAISMPMGLANDQLTEVPLGTYDSVHGELIPFPWQVSACALAGGKVKEIYQCLMQMEYVTDDGSKVAVVSAVPSKAKSPAFTTLGALCAAVELWEELDATKRYTKHS
jgi:invasion protein IalB